MELSQEKLDWLINDPNLLRDNYIYNIVYGSLANGASLTENFQIDASAYFIWYYGTMRATKAATTQTESTRIIPVVDFMLTDTSSGRQMSNLFTPLSNYFGTGQLPTPNPQPMLFSKNGNVQVEVSNNSGDVQTAETYSSIVLSFLGVKVYADLS